METSKLGKRFHFDNAFWQNPISCGFIDLYQLGEICCEHGYVIEAHEQYVHEITYVISGTGYSYVDGVKIPLREKDVLMCSMDHQHSIEVAERDCLRFAYLGFRFNAQAETEALRALKACYELPFVHIQDQNDVLFPFLHAIGEFYSKPVFWQAMLQNYCQQIVMQAVRDSLAARKIWPGHQRSVRSVSAEVYKIVQYVGEHAEEIVSVKEIARKMGYNITYLSHIFTKVTGTTLQKFISQKKIERACHLLKCGEFSVTAIAEKLGYGSVQSFSKAFLRVMGVTPTAYWRREQEAAPTAPQPAPASDREG